jgi:hypothetical protein
MRMLFLDQKNPLKEVMAEMKTHHNFSARYVIFYYVQNLANAFPSKAQYERQFKKWGFRKYIEYSDTIYRFIGYRVEKRIRHSKKSKVYLGGDKISDSKIRKEISRHYFPTMQEKYGQGQ